MPPRRRQRWQARIRLTDDPTKDKATREAALDMLAASLQRAQQSTRDMNEHLRRPREIEAPMTTPLPADEHTPAHPHNWMGPIAFLGHVTVDGRILDPNNDWTPLGDKVPVYVIADDGSHESACVGWARNIRRLDNNWIIVGQIILNLDALARTPHPAGPLYPNVNLSSDADWEAGPQGAVFRKGRIVAVVLGNRPAWPDLVPVIETHDCCNRTTPDPDRRGLIDHLVQECRRKYWQDGQTDAEFVAGVVAQLDIDGWLVEPHSTVAGGG